MLQMRQDCLWREPSIKRTAEYKVRACVHLAAMQELYKKANEFKATKQLDVDDSKAELDKFIRLNTVCDRCGSKIRRKPRGRSKTAHITIDCANDQCEVFSIKESIFHEMIADKINKLIDNSDFSARKTDIR